MLPIGEDNGIVEWVLNTTGLRHCLMDIYSAAGLYDSRTNRGIQKIWEGAPVVGGGVRGWVGSTRLDVQANGFRAPPLPALPYTTNIP